MRRDNESVKSVECTKTDPYGFSPVTISKEGDRDLVAEILEIN